MSFDAPTIKGERTEIKNGLFLITCEAEGNEKMMAFWNSARDLQFNIAYEFQAPELTPLGDTVTEGAKFAMSIYPGETKEFVRGKWKASRRTLSFGAPDKEWQDKQAKEQNNEVEGEIRRLKAALKKNPKADGKYTAEYIAEVALKEGVPFIDLTFPPKPSSIAREFEGKSPHTSSAWMRPSTYCPEGKSPCLYAGAIEPNDIDQGQLGDCYFMCALACVSEFDQVIQDVFLTPHPEYGIYRMRICKNGWWQVCVVDDLMPINGATKLPLFAKNREEPEELWVSLLEKAYAKLHGSYMAIKSGDPAMAMADLVGGPYEKLSSRPEWDNKDLLFQFLKMCDDDDHLMSLGTPGVDTSAYAAGAGAKDDLAKKYEEVGLCTGHAFSLIRVKESHGHRLCMIRNPWGNDIEWNGDWSDDSDLWTPEIQKDVGFYKGDDGTFWMAWDDVVKWFDSGSVSYVLPTYGQVRVAGNFEKGFPDVTVQIYVTKKVKCWFGAHQRDNRGLPSGDKDRQYLGLLLAVLREKENGNVEKIVTSGNGQFVVGRDVFAECLLEPSEKPYYILVQAYQDQDKSFTTSMFFSEPSSVKVHFVSPKNEEGKKKCNPVTRFVPANCNQKAAANFQVIMPKAKTPIEGSADGINWSTFATAPAKSFGPKKPMAIKPPPKHVDPAAGGGPGVGAPLSNKALNISVTVVSGHDLVSKDSNGFSDPFVTVIRLGTDGKKVPKSEEHSTKYINKTLNPVWGEVFTLKDVQPNQQLLFECWDKDIFGKDAMGSVKVPVSSLGLVPGGSGNMGDYKLVGGDATGHIKLLFTALA